jgi:anti-sigma regulatory factor (Ser/Thr protein kinase)
MKKLKESEKIIIVRQLRKRNGRTKLRRMRRTKRLAEIDKRSVQYRQMLLDQHLIVSGNPIRRPIILPVNLSFWENYNETARVIDDIRQYGLRLNLPLEVRFDRVRQLDPSATLALAAEIYRCQKLRVYRGGRFVSGNYPHDATVHAQLRDMGFFKLLQLSDHAGHLPAELRGARPVFLSFITDTKVIGVLVDQFVGIIEKHVCALNAAARGKLVGAIKEAMSNVHDHAYKSQTDVQSMQHRWFMSSRVDVERHEVMIVLYDQGNGISNTLDADLIERIRATLTGHSDALLHASDGYMIKLATELWRTGTGQSGRGRGFRNMKGFVDNSEDGELRVLSNRGYYTYVRDSEKFGDNEVSAGGTMIEWRFRSEGPLELNDD